MALIDTYKVVKQFTAVGLKENQAEARRFATEADISKLNAKLQTQVSQFNDQQDFQRDQWNKANQTAIMQSNVEWRRKANTINTAMPSSTTVRRREEMKRNAIFSQDFPGFAWVSSGTASGSSPSTWGSLLIFFAILGKTNRLNKGAEFFCLQGCNRIVSFQLKEPTFLPFISRYHQQPHPRRSVRIVHVNEVCRLAIDLHVRHPFLDRVS